MKTKFSLLFCLLCVSMMIACRSSKEVPVVPPPPVILTNTDSVRTEYIETVTIDTLTVFVEVPMESAKEVVPDSTSHLETNYATSDAWINPDGTLGHFLANKEQSIPVDVPVARKDTKTSYTSETVNEVPVPIPYTVPIERNFTKWESFRLGAFWYLFGITFGLFVFVFRKPLVKILRKCFVKG